MSTPKTVQKMNEPDPTPTQSSMQGVEAMNAARRQRQKIQNQNGRQKTILAGTTPALQQVEKTNILGS
jgi:hypothetical protein